MPPTLLNIPPPVAAPFLVISVSLIEAVDPVSLKRPPPAVCVLLPLNLLAFILTVLTANKLLLANPPPWPAEFSINLNDVKIIENTAGQGGGIANSSLFGVSTININASKFKGNNTPTAGGGLFNDTGSTASINDTEITRNGAATGGGIFNNVGGILNLFDTDVNKNVPDNIVNL